MRARLQTISIRVRYGIAVRDGAGSEPCSVDIAGEGVDLSGNAAGKAMRWPNL